MSSEREATVVGTDPERWPGPTECPKCKRGDPFNIWSADHDTYGVCIKHRVFWHMGQLLGCENHEVSVETHRRLLSFVPATFEGDLSALPPEAARGGDCPYCGRSYYLNVYKNHWGYCDEHRVRWPIGYGLFSSWQEEDEETWRRNAEKIAEYRAVEPWFRDDELSPACTTPPQSKRCPTCHALESDRIVAGGPF